MKILSIETSCDDTCLSITEGSFSGKEKKFKILSEKVSSQIEIHRKWGGIYPTLAKREHQKNLPTVLKEVLESSGLLEKSSKIFKKNLKEISDLLKKIKKPEIDIIAVTKGPGLEPCLWVGINFAKTLSKCWDIPIIPVDHIESHILASLISENGKIKKIEFPALSLVVSGGHTQLVLIKNIGEYKIIGETRDDAAGECFDKTARILGLDYPGGPAIAHLAEQWKNQISTTNTQIEEIKLPRPMINQKNYDFSFSGLKTAVLYKFKKTPKSKKSKKYIQAMCFEIQQSIIDVLLKKTIRAAKNYKVKSIILGGGVASNKELRQQFKKKMEEKIEGIKCYVPEKEYCTDNAVMTAITALHHLKDTEDIEELKAESNLRIGKD